MTPARYAAILARRGETWTLRRLGAPNVDVTVKGKRYGAASETVVNGLTRTTFKIRLGNTEIAAAGWPGPPRAKDQMLDSTARAYIVEWVDTRKVGASAFAHIVQVTG